MHEDKMEPVFVRGNGFILKSAFLFLQLYVEIFCKKIPNNNSAGVTKQMTQL